MDALADILRSINLTASTDFCTAFKGAWGMDIDGGNKGVFHAVLDGECWLYVYSNDQMIRLQKGDVVAFPTGGPHWISDQPSSERQSGKDVIQAIQSGHAPFDTAIDADANYINLLCGAFHYDTQFKHPFLADLPCFIHARVDDVRVPELHNLIIKNISLETQANAPGSELLINRLGEILFVYLLRQYIENNEGDLLYLRALNDPQIGKALNLIHGETEAQWSVEGLASYIGLSRTAFGEKFSEKVGMPPRQYLTHWRMQRAKLLLENSKKTMIDIAEASGYASEASFSKAFKTFFGVSPGGVRKRS